MVPPPITPSPHRFLAGLHTQATEKQPSQKHAVHPSFIRKEHTSAFSSRQFASTPRFSSSQLVSSRSIVEDASPQETEVILPSSPLVSRAKRSLLLREDGGHEDIEDVEDQEEDDDLQNSEIINSVEEGEVVLDSEGEMQPLKRRHPYTPLQSHATKRHAWDLSTEHEICSTPSPTSPCSPSLSPPSLLKSPNTFPFDVQSHSKFRFSHPSNLVDTPATYGPMTSRPSFVIPPITSADEKSILLPEAFSPHRQRKGLKYVPEGLAATVRDWALDVSNISRGKVHRDRIKQENLVTVLEVDNVTAWTGMALVAVSDNHKIEGGLTVRDQAAEEEQAEPRTWVLIGEGNHIIKKGSRVEIKVPTWDIQIGEQNYGVGLDWDVVR